MLCEMLRQPSQGLPLSNVRFNRNIDDLYRFELVGNVAFNDTQHFANIIHGLTVASLPYYLTRAL